MPTSVDYEEGKVIAAHSVCAGCGARLSVAWGGFFGIDGYVLRCGRDPDHEGFKKYRATKTLSDGRRYDVVTQKPVDEHQALAIPKDEKGMIDRANQALSIGLFPSSDKVTKQQVANLAKLAVLYGLDPLMKEIIPFAGQPYITIEGRRRIDDRSGHHPSIRHRPLTLEERQFYQEVDAIQDGDICLICVLTTEWGNTIEGFGRVKKSERSGNQYLPTVSWSMEMALKRSESRARKMAYGPVALPGGLDSHLRLIEEGDVIEGEWQEIQDTPLSEPQPPQESDAGDIFPEEEPADAPQVPEAFKAVVDRAGNAGLDLRGFCERVLPARCHTIEAFVSLGGTPDAAEKRLEEYLKR